MSTCHIARRPPLGTSRLEHADHLPRRHRPSPGDRQALPRGFREERPALQPPSIGGLGMDQGSAPDMMGMRRMGWRGRAGAPGAPLPPVLDALASFRLADAPDGLTTAPPVGTLQQVVKLPLPQARLGRRERMKAR
jgi:hypothetical protein